MNNILTFELLSKCRPPVFGPLTGVTTGKLVITAGARISETSQRLTLLVKVDIVYFGHYIPPVIAIKYVRSIECNTPKVGILSVMPTSEGLSPVRPIR